MEWFYLVLISAVFLSARNIFTKKILVKENTLSLMFFISLFSFLGVLVFYDSLSFNFSFYVYFLLFVKSLVISVAWFSIYEAYKRVDISTVAPLRNLSPVFLVVLGLVFLNESASFLSYLGIFLLIFCAYLLELKSSSNLLAPFKFFKSKYFLLIVISMIGNSISAVLDKVLIEHINYYSILFFFYLFLSVIYFAFIVLKRDFGSFNLVSDRKNFLFVLAISLFALLADFSYFLAVAMPGTFIILIIPIRRLSTFFEVVVGGRVFNEKNLLYKGVICLIMIFAIFLIIS